jgi:hypothetical protein
VVQTIDVLAILADLGVLAVKEIYPPDKIEYNNIAKPSGALAAGRLLF